jgi:hypothetical protein
MNHSQGHAARIQELPEPIIVDVPCRSIPRRLRSLLCGPSCTPKVADELIAIPSLSERVEFVLPADQIANGIPGFGGKVFCPNFAVPREMQILGMPS